MVASSSVFSASSASRISLGGAHGAERVVLVDLRHAEHGHDGVADELLDGAPVVLDRRPHRVEVPPMTRRTDSGSSASPIAVEPATSQNTTVTVLRTSCGVAWAASGAAQFSQNFAPSRFSCPHASHRSTSAA